MFPASPSHATDAQLSQMAKGGLPNAVNEEITRLALRRGSRAVPQQPVPLPQRKMSGEEMIEDFVRRVRQENANAANSIVPAGTPMQQQPQQPQPAQASGIAGFESGGANVRIPKLQRDQNYDWLPGGDAPLKSTQSGKGPTLPAVKPVRPFDVQSRDSWKMADPYTMPYGFGVPAPTPTQEEIDAYNGFLQKKAMAAKGASLDERFKEPGFFQEERRPEIDYGGAGSAETGIAALMADAPRLGAFKPSEYIRPEKYTETDLIDLNKAGNDRVAAMRDRIDALASPYNEGAAELEGMSEEIKRKEIFNGMVQAGIAMMQGGGASFDPRSGDMMAIMGDGASAYVESLSKDAKRQQELKEKIVAYKGAANELTFNAENQMFGQGADLAQAQNQLNVTRDGFRNQYNRGVASDQNQFNQGRDTLLLQERGQQLQADIAAFEANLKLKLSQEGGVDPEIAEKIANNAGQHYQSAFNTYLSQAGFSEVSDPTQKEKILKDAQAQGVAASSAYMDRINAGLFGGQLGDIESISRTEQGRYMAGAADEGIAAGVPVIERPYAPQLNGKQNSKFNEVDYGWLGVAGAMAN